MNYKPFNDRKRLIQRALQAAVLWEESRIDAGICDDADLINTKAEIKAYERYLKHIAPNRPLTLHEQMDEDLRTGKARLISLHEFMGNDSEGGQPHG